MEVLKQIHKSDNVKIQLINQNNELKVLRIFQNINEGQWYSQSLMNIKSNNVVKYYQSSIVNHEYLVFEEYCNCGNLRQFINKRKVQDNFLKPSQILNFIAQLIIGLHDINLAKYKHRDLRPENILIQQLDDGNIILKISGCRLFVGKDDSSKYYTPPETLKQQLTQGPEQDWFQLGCIIQELCNLDLPFNHICKNPQELISDTNYQLQLQPQFQREGNMQSLVKMLTNRYPRLRLDYYKIMQTNDFLKLKNIIIELKPVTYQILKELPPGKDSVNYQVKYTYKSHELVCTLRKFSDVEIGKRMLTLHRAINSPYVQKFYEGFEDRGTLCIISEYFEEGTLESYMDGLKDADPLSLEQIIDFITTLIAAIHDIHKANIVHRNIKPNIIIVSKDDDNKTMLKLSGLGLARFQNNQEQEQLIANVCFTAPEVQMGLSAGFPADMFSLGCILFYLCQKKAPYSHLSHNEITDQMIYGLEPLESISDYYGEEIQTLISQLMIRDPQLRLTFDNIIESPQFPNIKQVLLDKCYSINTGSFKFIKQLAICGQSITSLIMFQGQLCVLKQYRIYNKEDASNEAKILESLNSIHVVKLKKVFEDNGAFCLITEYCDGGDLTKYMMGLKRKLTTYEICDMFSQMLIGITEIHAAGIIHRDIKPENIFIMVGQQNKVVVKIGDFGISRQVQTHMTQACGTSPYMSPEAWDNQNISIAIDLFALGGVLFYMCEGKTPFMDKNDQNSYACANKIMNSSYTLLLGFGHPDELRKLVVGLTIRDPYKRLTIDNILNSDDFPCMKQLLSIYISKEIALKTQAFMKQQLLQQNHLLEQEFQFVTKRESCLNTILFPKQNKVVDLLQVLNGQRDQILQQLITQTAIKLNTTNSMTSIYFANAIKKIILQSFKNQYEISLDSFQKLDQLVIDQVTGEPINANNYTCLSLVNLKNCTCQFIFNSTYIDTLLVCGISFTIICGNEQSRIRGYRMIGRCVHEQSNSISVKYSGKLEGNK